MDMEFMIGLSLGVCISNIFIGRFQQGNWKDGFILGALSGIICFVLALLANNFLKGV